MTTRVVVAKAPNGGGGGVGLLDLPGPVLERIVAFCGQGALFSLRLVCSTLRRAASRPELYEVFDLGSIALHPSKTGGAYRRALASEMAIPRAQRERFNLGFMRELPFAPRLPLPFVRLEAVWPMTVVTNGPDGPDGPDGPCQASSSDGSFDGSSDRSFDAAQEQCDPGMWGMTHTLKFPAKVALTANQLGHTLLRGSAVVGGSLRALVLSGPWITDDHLRVAFAGNGLSVERLVLNGCRFVTDDGVGYALRASGPQLVELGIAELPRVTDATVTLLSQATAPHRLTKLDMSRLPCITDDAVGTLMAGTGALVSLKVGGCSLLSDVSLGLAAKSNTELVHVDMCKTQITDETVRMLATRARDLRSLNIASTHVTDRGVLAVCRCSLSIATLDISGTRVTNAVFASLDALPRLARLSLADCRYVTDAGVKALAESAPGLTHLDISLNNELSNALITDSLVSHNALPRLARLNLECTRASPSTLASLTKARPGLDIAY